MMMTLIAAAALAAQPAPAQSAPAPMAAPAGHSMQSMHEKHEGMMADCCKHCCDEMKAKMGDHHAEGAR